MTSFRYVTLPFGVTLLLVIGGCAKGPGAEHAEAAAASSEKGSSEANERVEERGGKSEAGKNGEAGAPLTMDDDELEAAGIRLLTLQASKLSEELRAPGEVVDNSYGTTLITPRVEALVLRRHARLGDEVRAGAPLVTLGSVEVSDAQAELRIAEQEWQRVSALGREAVSGRRISEAKVAVDRARAKALAYGVSATSTTEADGQFTLTAPHSGRITEDAFVVGERIEPGTTLFRLVDESVVWVDAKMPAATSVRVKPGSPATIVFNGSRIAGTVQESAHRTSDVTRNAVVRIKVPNGGDQLHAGDFVDVFFESGAVNGQDGATTLSVPSDALVQLLGDTVVFRRNSHGALEPVPVRTGEVIGDRTVIHDGLKPGDTVVVEGAFVIKSQMLKSQLGEEE